MHDGARQAGEGKKLGKPSNRDVNARTPGPFSVRSCADLFGSGAASSSSDPPAAVGSQRPRDAGGTPTRADVSKVKREPDISTPATWQYLQLGPLE